MISFEAYAGHKDGVDRDTLFNEWLAMASLRNRPIVKAITESGDPVMIHDDGGYTVPIDDPKGRVLARYSRTGELYDYGGYYR